MKKVFDQTVRDLKREVNKKVLKVPSIEQKVLDATSNEPWGPHGTLLADIAQASRNYHEYQMIMTVIWKRVNDTGKNWRHVYKALTVLEYLVAHGSERVIDEIREHAYQISTLSDFQYIDSSGRDQGNNVRRKSQSLVMLVNDKERIAEARQKAAANRDKFRSMSSGGSMYKPNSGGYNDRYDDDRYGGRYRDDDRDREWTYRDDDRSSRNGDSYSRDGDRYSRDSEERNGRDSYRDDDHRGRSRNVDDYQYGPRRSRSSDRDRERAYDDDGQYSSRGSISKADDGSLDGRRLDRKFSEQNLGPPPSYEEAVNESRSPAHGEREQEVSTSAPKPSSPPARNDASPHVDAPPPPASPVKQEFGASDEFDPRGPLSAAPTSTTTNSAEMDFLGSLSDSFAPNPLAIMPVTSAATTTSDAHADTGFGSTFAAAPPASNSMNQSFEDPFGDTPFKAIPSADAYPVQQPATSAASFQANMNQNVEPPQMTAPITHPSLTNNQFVSQEQSNSNFETDILADILPPSGPLPATASQATFSAPGGQSVVPPSANPYGEFGSQTGTVAPGVQQISPDMHSGTTSHFNLGNFQQQAENATMRHVAPQAHSIQSMQVNNGNVHSQAGFMAAAGAQTPPNRMSNTHFPGDSFLPSGPPTTSFASHMAQNPNGSVGQINNSSFQQGSQVAVAPQGAQQAPFGGVPQNKDGLSNILPQTGPNNSNFQHGSQVPAAPQGAPQAPFGIVPQNNDGLSNLLPQTGPNNSNFQQGSQVPVASQSAQQAPFAGVPQNKDGLSNLLPQMGSNMPSTLQSTSSSSSSSSEALAIVPQPSKDKFETKSTVWADTLSRGLVNLNISGPKINPLADIGIDFDAINRKEKRMEKPSVSAVTSTVTMGKAMGAGSGIGRAGAGALRPAPNPMVGSNMGMGMGGSHGSTMGGMGMGAGMGMGGGQGSGMGMGGYGGMNQQPMGMGMGMGMNMGMGMSSGYNTGGMGMNMGMGRGAPMQQGGYHPGSAMPGGYNNPMGRGSGYPQQPYGGGYR